MPIFLGVEVVNSVDRDNREDHPQKQQRGGQLSRFEHQRRCRANHHPDLREAPLYTSARDGSALQLLQYPINYLPPVVLAHTASAAAAELLLLLLLGYSRLSIMCHHRCQVAHVHQTAPDFLSSPAIRQCRH